MLASNLCTPALIYLIFSVSQVLIDTFKGMFNTALVKILLTIIFTFLLNYLCQAGLGILSWIIIFVPFILMSVIVTMLLFVFNLDPKTGKIRRVEPRHERGNRDVILYHDHGHGGEHGEHGEHGRYRHGKGVDIGEYSPAQPLDVKRNYRFEFELEHNGNIDMNTIRDQRLSNY